MKTIKTLFAICAISFGLSAHATLINDDISVSIVDGSSVLRTTNVLVGANVELPDYFDLFSIDIGANSINMDCTGSLCGNQTPMYSQGNLTWLFEDLDLLGGSPILGATLLSDISGTTMSFTGDSISIVVLGSSDPLSRAFINVSFNIRNAVPASAPATIALLGLGFVGLRWSKRKHQS